MWKTPDAVCFYSTRKFAYGDCQETMINFLQRLQDMNRRMPLKEKSYFKTHPYVPDRIRVVKQELGEQVGFSDYINIEQRKKGTVLLK